MEALTVADGQGPYASGLPTALVARLALAALTGLGCLGGCTLPHQPAAAEESLQWQHEPPRQLALTRRSPSAPADIGTPPADAQRAGSGVLTKVLREGAGAERPGPSDAVRVNYTAWSADGHEFDGSEPHGHPAVFSLDLVIPGWAEGVGLMVEGEKRRLWLPEAEAHRGKPGLPSGPLVFDVELLEILRAPKTPDHVLAPPPDAEILVDGVSSRVLQPGRGTRRPLTADRVRLHYSAWTTAGRLLDSSLLRGQPGSFRMDTLIPGLETGLRQMVEGEKRRLWIPEEVAFHGLRRRPEGMLVVDVELLAILAPLERPDSLARPPESAARTASGLAFQVLSAGRGGRHPAPADRVTLLYERWTEDGTLFDSTTIRGRPETVAVGGAIPGLAEALPLMRVGEKRRLWLPPQLAFPGTPGRPSGRVVFDVELLAIEGP